MKTGTPEFRVNRERDGLEPLVYHHIDQMTADYKNDVVSPTKPSAGCNSANIIQLTPQLIKPAVADALVELIAPIRAAFEASPEWQDVIQKAYPPPPQKEKKKKQKDKGSRHPGAGNAQAADQAKPAAAEAN